MTNKQYFTSQAYVPGDCLENPGGQQVNLAKLPALLRCLLVTDGTVTKTIEAYFWEPVAVKTVAQQMAELDSDISFIERKKGDIVLERLVQLVGAQSSKIYATAASYISTDLLPPEQADQLVQGKIGIGELLRETGLETYREIVDFGVATGAGSAEKRRIAGQQEELFRTYRIFLGGKPVMQITEYFPLEQYLVPN